jgi:PAS domain S-box-containing protein
MTAPLFNDETERLEALWRFDILDTAPEQAFDDLTRLAAQICGTPIALVTLADESRHWAKSATGTVPREMPRDIAFSEYAIHESGPLVVPDARADARFAAHPLVVSEPYVRYYAGVPVRTPEGLALGTLCVMDTVPRVLTQAQTDALLTLGRQVVAQMQLRRYASAREQDAVRAREALREESALRGLFMESATGAMVAFDLQRRFTLVNRRMCEITGRSEAELIGRPFASLQSPEAIAKLVGTFGRIITERTPAEGLETELLRPDGATVSVAFNAAPIVRDGVVVGVAATATDITERKRAQALLEAQRHILEMILADRSLDQVLMAVAVAVEQLAGTQCAVLLTDERGATLACVAIPTLPESFAAAIDGIAIGPVAASCGTAAFRKAPVMTRDIDADPLWREYRELAAGQGLRAAWSTPILSPEGPVLGTLALYTREPRLPDEWQTRVIETATALAALAIQRTRAQKRIVDSEARYRLLWETSMDALIVMDDDGRVLFANSALLHVFGYMPEEVIGHDLAMLQPERLRDAHRQSFRRYVTTGEKRLDWRAVLAVGRHKDGHEFPIDVAFNDVRVGGTRQFAGLIRDISERSRAEDALRESEARYRALAENAFDLVCELDSAGRFAYASPNFESVLGYSPVDLIGRVAFELIHPGDQERVVQEYAGAIADPASGTITFRFRRSDTTWAWLDVSANVYRNEAGESRAVIVSRDIGERMAMEATLRESEARLRSFVRNAPLILFATDREGVYTLYEGQGLERLGLRPGHYVGGSMFNVHARYPEVVDGARRALAGEEVTYQFRGPLAALEVHQSPVRDEQGKVTGTIGLVMDVTDRIHAMEALRRSEERYRAIFETHGAAWLLIDPATGLIEEANRAACEFYGYSAEEMAGKPVSEINTLTRDEILEEMRRARDEHQTLFRFTHRLKSGETRDVDVYTGPVEVDSRPLLFSIVQDVTDRRRAESLVAAQGRLLEMIAVGAPIEMVFETLANTVEEHAPGALCSLLLLSPDGKRLRHAAAPSLPDAYNQAIDGTEIGPAVGSCGTAAYRREEVVVEDIATDPFWADFRDLPLSHGLRSCWSTPILSSAGEVLGTIAVYYREPGSVREHDRALVGIATHLAGIAIERERAEQAMHGRAAELERMYGRLAEANTELETSNTRIEEKSLLLERALELERERSRRDQLTGTLNHAAITDALRETICEANAGTLAIAMVDVDGLKAANDTYGHQVGDAVLALVARHLMRDGAAVGRYGGDEFVSILRGADQHTSEAYRKQRPRLACWCNADGPADGRTRAGRGEHRTGNVSRGRRVRRRPDPPSGQRDVRVAPTGDGARCRSAQPHARWRPRG